MDISCHGSQYYGLQGSELGKMTSLPLRNPPHHQPSTPQQALCREACSWSVLTHVPVCSVSGQCGVFRNAGYAGKLKATLLDLVNKFFHIWISRTSPSVDHLLHHDSTKSSVSLGDTVYQLPLIHCVFPTEGFCTLIITNSILFSTVIATTQQC